MEHFNDNRTMQCFKIPDSVVGNFKISCDTTCSKVVLWSKYQLYIYKDLNFNINDSIETQFEITDVIVMKDYLICLDVTGNLNILDSFVIWKQNIKCVCYCNTMNKQLLVSLQLVQNRFSVLLNEFCSNDSPSGNVSKTFNMPQEDWMTLGKSVIMACEYVSSIYSERVNNLFNVDSLKSDYLLLIISMDKRYVYAVLYPLHPDLQMDLNSHWVKLHKSYSDIIDIKIIIRNDILIFVGVSSGNILRIPLLLKNRKPEVFHLNTAIYKFAIIYDTVLYTDGLTMWKNENAFSETDFKFEQFKVRNVKDFCLINNKVICNTFSNFIYTFNIHHNSSYLTLDTDDTCAVEMITNSDYLQELMETIQKNEEVLKKINHESEYLMALSLSKRQDLLKDLINVRASVFDFDEYREHALKNKNLTLTDHRDAYCSSESYYFLVNVIVHRVQHKLNKLLSDVLDDIKIHITLSEHGVLKTTSIQIKEQLKTTNFVIPLKRKNLNINRMQVYVKIITNVPGIYDKNHSLWTILYHTCIHLDAHKFIDVKTNTNIHLKDDEDSLDLLIYKRAQYLYDKEYVFHISDPSRYEWTFFVQLPYSDMHMRNILASIESACCKRAYPSLMHLGKMCSFNNLEFQIGKDQVQLNIEDDYLKMTCKDIKVALHIRTFFSCNIFNKYKWPHGEKLIDHKNYTKIENLKRDFNVYIERRAPKEEFAELVDKFLKNLYCLIPI